ncbi:MAG: capsule biosynthesis protein CapK [Blastopirellula sp.]|nr:MAG: capsule biosynthesis protein CapK [Blastopirellula sp.]
MKSVYKNILIPAFETFYKRRKTLQYLKRLEETQWMSLGNLMKLQQESLESILAHAYENIPYYNTLWNRNGLTDIKSLINNFERLPLLTKEIINTNQLSLQAPFSQEKLIAKSTGGSTGMPLHFYIDKGSYERRNAISLRGYKWAGADLGTKQFYLWGGALDNPGVKKVWKDRIYHLIHRRNILNSFTLNQIPVEQSVKRFNHTQPDVLVAYTNALYHFATDLERAGISPWSPKSIIVGAEKLHDFQRRKIESIFNTDVYETYGSREFMLIGSECHKHEGLHLSFEHLIVEILNEDGSATKDGEVGNIVITDLFNYGMPFIRYLTGDQAVAGIKMCTCGRELPLLREVKGRQLDMLTFANGRKLPGEFFPHLFKDYSEISRFQVTQKTDHTIQISVVLAENLPQNTERNITSIIQNHVGDDVTVSWKEVNTIPLTLAGKHRVVVNQCA